MSYDVYRAAGEPSAEPLEPEPRDTGPWHVVVEYSNGGQAKPPTIAEVRPDAHAERSYALAAALHEAWTFTPPDPWVPVGREVYRDGPDGFLVIVPGKASRFHFTVRLVVPAPRPPGAVGSSDQVLL